MKCPRCGGTGSPASIFAGWIGLGPHDCVEERETRAFLALMDVKLTELTRFAQEELPALLARAERGRSDASIH